jgi:hypothetical protein
MRCNGSRLCSPPSLVRGSSLEKFDLLERHQWNAIPRGWPFLLARQSQKIFEGDLESPAAKAKLRVGQPISSA